MLSMQDLNRERFDSQDFNSNITTANQFIFYYLQLVEFATVLKIITENQKNAIINNLTQEISDLANAQPHIVSNYLYVVTLYLQSKSNWEAWQELEKLQYSKNVSGFITNVSSWFLNQVHILKNKMTAYRKDVSSLKCESFSKDFKNLQLYITELTTFASAHTCLVFKTLHTSHIAIQYTTLSKITGKNYFETLTLTIHNFITELLILKDINGLQILQNQKKLLHNAHNSISEKSNALSSSLEDALEKLKLEFDARMKKHDEAQEKLDQKMNELEEEFKKNNPHLSEDALEVAFDKYLDSLPADFWKAYDYEDEQEINRWYSTRRNKIIKQFEIAEKKLEKESFNDQLSIEPLNKDSLESIIKEFALFNMAQKQEIVYPTTLAEKNSLLLKIDIKNAIPEFIANFQDKLSDVEMEYLRKAVNM